MNFYFNYNSYQFKIKTLEQEDYSALNNYCLTCREEGVINNASPEKMKIGVFKNEKWWVVYDLHIRQIVSVAGVHLIPELSQDTWRIMHRLATIKAYRGRAGALSKDQRACFGWGRMLPLQINYCRDMGAKKIIFTTNAGSDGDIRSLKQNKICELVFEKLGMAKKIETRTLFYVKQNIWEVQIENVYTKKPLNLTNEK